MMKSLIYLVVLTTFLQFSKCSSTNNKGLDDMLKNRTTTNFNSTNQNEDESLMKEQANKYMRECGSEGSKNYDENDSRDDENDSRRGNKSRRRNADKHRNSDDKRYSNDDSNEGNGDNRYGNKGSDNPYDKRGSSDNRYGKRGSDNRYGRRGGNNRYNSYGSDSDRDNNGYGSDNNDGYSHENYDNENDSEESNYGQHRKNRNNRTGGMGSNFDCKEEQGYNGGNRRNDGHQDQWGYSGSNYGPNRGSGSGPSYDRNYGGFDRSGSRRGYGTTGFSRNIEANPVRPKRSNTNNDDDADSQCVSQCVFGYLEVLDDNRMPSETLVIKWLQEHIANDMKRMRAYREARRCFAKLSTSDTEDGCKFSKTLSNCLNLELE